MSKHRKAKPALKPEALAWLAEKMSPTEWSRVLDLHLMSIEALFVYVRSLCNDALYQEFMDLNEPELAAERRKAEEKAAEAARQERLTIHMGAPGVTGADIVANKGAWRSATLTDAERAEAEKIAEEERSGTRLIPAPYFDKLLPNST